MSALKIIFHSSIIFWGAWVAIPIMMGIIPKIVDYIALFGKSKRKEIHENMNYQPEITLVIPVDNSAANLYRCINSIQNSIYDKEKIEILLIDHMSTDNSFEIFCQCQEEFRDLKMNWIQSKKAKSHALNLALYNSYGKYMIHIDSEGVLHPEAIYNMVRKFEMQPKLQCMTGAIMINPKMIEETSSIFVRLLRKVEYFDYCQNYYARRKAQEKYNNAIALSGAFYAFRRSAVLKTQFGSKESLIEDMIASFPSGEFGQEKFALCKDAICFVNPIDTLDGLYAQRQRLFALDNALVFSGVIWYLVLICLGLIHYSFHLVVQAGVIMYGIYVLSSVLLYLSAVLVFGSFRNVQTYITQKKYMVFILPIYDFIIFGVRFMNAVRSNRLLTVHADRVAARN